MAKVFSRKRELVRSLRRTAASLWRDEQGISLVEFGLVLPLLVGLGMYGVEIAYMTSTNMQVSQLALGVADNASRLGQTDNSAISPTVAETDIDAVMFGAVRQGQGMNFEQSGRVILSSIELGPNDEQFIHWQRCAGELVRDSGHGNDTNRNGLTGTPLPALGDPDDPVLAADGQAVMYVEVFYTYQPLFGGMFFEEMTFSHDAMFLVRDDRNLNGGGGDGLSGTTSSVCTF